jgi:hypothetical protein
LSKTLGVSEVVILLQRNNSIHNANTYFNPNISNPNSLTLIEDNMSVSIESSYNGELAYAASQQVLGFSSVFQVKEKWKWK